MRTRFVSRSLPAYMLLIATVIILGIVDGGRGRFLNTGTVFSVLQQFATLGPVALGLGLTMTLQEFDLSVGGNLSLAGFIAVLFGGESSLLGLSLAVLVGIAAGALQGGIMIWLRLRSIGVTLGGLLSLIGLCYVISNNQTIGYDRFDVVIFLNRPILAVLSPRSLAALAVFLVATLVIASTRIGRDVVAVGSNRRAATTAGVGVAGIIVGVFAVSGGLAALSGSLLSYSLATASPLGLADVLVPATAAAIIGGVSLSGGKGSPVGIAGGVLVLCTLRSGLTAVGAPPFFQAIVTGSVLLVVAILDGQELAKRTFLFRRLCTRIWERLMPS